MQQQTEFSISAMCRVLKVSRSGYYESLKQLPSAHNIADKELALKVKEEFHQNRKLYGARRIKNELQKQQINLSRRRIIKLMKKEHLVVKTRRKFKATTNSQHNYPVAPNLLERNFTVSAQDVAYVSDITYIKTLEGWLYLAVVIDLFSRAVVGWSMDSRINANLVNNALLMALRKRKPTKGLISHSDRGVQYASHSHAKIIKEYGLKASMSRKGDCWDNAVAESFFHTLKIELIYQNDYKTRSDAKSSIFEYIEVFYNRQRSHSTIGYNAPLAFEAM